MFFILIFFWLIPYTLSNWLIWQNLKTNTSLPCGEISRKYGWMIGWTIKILYFSILFLIIKSYGFKYILSYPIIWFFSGWFATELERKLYMNKSIEYIKSLSHSMNNKYFINMILVPKWYFDLMSSNWQDEYLEIIEKYKK